MNKIILTGLILSATLSASATTFYEQLCDFNFNWKKYSMVAPKGEARTFETDADYVQSHLSCVIPILRANPTAQLNEEQLSTRRQMIETLDAYRLAKTFPLNHYRHERIPVFIDEHGTHCAVGYLMMMSGYEDLAQRIAHSDNYVWVKDIKDPEALAWQEYSGFTLEELKLIQGAYDWYDPMAWTVPNKFETPQQPICTTAYFDDSYGKNNIEYYHHGIYAITAKPIYTTLPDQSRQPAKPAEVKDKSENNVWCKGEGNGKVINGKWEQNYGPGIPWIKGFFINGQRSGNWEEYYPGTTILCRTESWRNNKLNGVRTRYNYQSQVIEEIIFVEGNAVCKTNYDLNDSLAYVRIPENDSIVSTRVYNSQGKLIACGKEKIYNPSGLLWFQNIQLTALNSMQVSTRSTQIAMGTSNNSSFGNDGGYNSGVYGQSQSLRSLFSGGGGQPALVEYHKFGTWWYYQDQSQLYASQFNNRNQPRWWEHYQHYGLEMYRATCMFSNIETHANYDSLRVNYDDNNILQFVAFKKAVPAVHGFFEYYSEEDAIALNTYQWTAYYHDAAYYNSHKMRKLVGEYNADHERIGTWITFNINGQAIKEEKYLVPMKEEESEEVKNETAGK
jgi:antitoxin component YwqK of YwqJK toxin-antitoxin module